jgi:pimeloyl-ACP methyl ester carboxylesterase
MGDGIMIRGRRGKIFAQGYVPGGEGPFPTVILFHGIPGNEQNLDLMQHLRRCGFSVITFHYSGCWGSEGEYRIANNLEDSETVFEFVKSCGADWMGFDPDNIYVVGHSLGGFAAAHMMARHSEIKGGVLITPCDIGRFAKMSKEGAEGVHAILEDAQNWLNETSAEIMEEELRAHAEDYPLATLAGRLAGRPLLIIGGTLDTATPPKDHCEPLESALNAEGAKHFKSLRFPIDHSASDYRLALCDAVAEFLTE